MQPYAVLCLGIGLRYDQLKGTLLVAKKDAATLDTT